MTVFGGAPYKVTAVEPVAELRWSVKGVPEPVHPRARKWNDPPYLGPHG
ncbi:MAG: hypothetical protein ACYCTI_00220 [Acidimicrobiales bacterium]